MKDLKKLFENKHVRKVKKFHRLIDDYVYKSFTHVEKSFTHVNKILSSFKSKVKTKEFFLKIVK